MALRNIVTVGDPILNKKCRTVTKFDDRLATLLDDMKQDIKSLTLPELKDAFRALGEPAFRAGQVFAWLWRGAESFEEMTNLSKSLRDRLDGLYFISRPTAARKQVSQKDGTIKYLWRLGDGNCVESVVMDVDRLLNETARPSAARTAPPRSAAERAVHAPVSKKPAQGAAKESEPAHRSSHVATIAGIICIALAVIGIGYFLYSYFFSDLIKKTAEDTVPKFVGMNMSEIDETKYPNFTLDYSNQQPSDQYPSGYIIAQSPDPDTTVKVGTTIKLTVSTGPQTNTMPDLVNKSLQSAQSYLDKMAIQVVVNVTYEDNEDYTDGYVIRTDPTANTALTEGQTVTLVVCQKSDAEMVPVPALVGMCRLV